MTDVPDAPTGGQERTCAHAELPDELRRLNDVDGLIHDLRSSLDDLVDGALVSVEEQERVMEILGDMLKSLQIIRAIEMELDGLMESLRRDPRDRT
jgi:hypothetical protein